MSKTKLFAMCALLAAGSAAKAGTVFLDTFEGAQAGLDGQTFNSGATTGFTHWQTSMGSMMDAGYFDVVHSAHDIHSLFIDAPQPDGDTNGHYAVFNGFGNVEGLAYSKTLNLAAGTYTFSADLLALTTPQYPEGSIIQFRLDGTDLIPTSGVNPSSPGWMNASYTFTVGAGNHTLSISNLAGPSDSGNDFGLDNVKVASVPTPAGFAGGIAGLGALAAYKARRRGR